MTYNNDFLVTGGVQHEPHLFQHETILHKEAVALTVDWRKKNHNRVFAYKPDDGVCYKADTSVFFKTASIYKDKLYLCTNTRIFIIDIQQFKLLEVYSSASFNDLHHLIFFDNKIAVVSTGLDMVVLIDIESKEESYLHVFDEYPWERLSKDIDYRNVRSTKPHLCHPNHLFQIDHQLWVTRFEQCDAICLSDRSKRMEIGLNNGIHDGTVHGDYVYFTSVDGMIAVVNKNTLELERVLDLNKIENGESPLGWCRGLYVSKNRAYVGFSKLRLTKTKKNLKWIKHKFKYKEPLPTRICEYDMSAEKKLSEYIFPEDELNVLYSILPFDN
jgi:hypothetical protein